MNHRSNSGAVLLLLLAMATVVSAIAVSSVSGNEQATYIKEEAKKYYWGVGVEQDLKKALQLYEKAASLGDAEASYIAGGMYYMGKGSPRNPYKAFSYLDFAAKNGKSSRESQRALAEFYIMGEVVPQNYREAVQRYKKAAEEGDKQSQLELGYMYFTGQGVDQDSSEAFRWFYEAAMQNYNMAQYNLGIMWYTGNGVKETNINRSYAWFSIAATNNFPDAAIARDYLGSFMSSKDIADAQNIAASLFEQIREK